MNDIYSSGEYIELNPTLHNEDSFFKYSNIQNILKKSNILKDNISYKILDIGGGNGQVGKYFCEYLFLNHIEFEFHALDLSEEMLNIQKSNNQYLSKVYSGELEALAEHYDIVLMIDVIEHIVDYNVFLSELNRKSSFIIFNIPIEKNVFDRMRNIYLKCGYYKEQFRTLGHVNFYTYSSSIKLLRAYFELIELDFVPYSNHILDSDYSEYKLQKKSTFRLLELKISSLLHTHFPIISKYIIQGSCYSLVKTKYK
jgi:ubiquinone/menaquinone biosynthesis C-methylase UbiE